MSTPEVTPAPSKVDQIDQLAQIGLAVASQFAPKAAGTLGEVAGLEPVVSHLVLAFIHLFRHTAAQQQAASAAAAK